MTVRCGEQPGALVLVGGLRARARVVLISNPEAKALC